MTVTTKSIDAATFHLLQHQARRMNHVLHAVVPPDRAEAERIQKRVDDILDRRPRPIAVASDGEILWEGASPYVVAQAAPLPYDNGGNLQPGATTAVNATGEPEPVLAKPVDLSGDDVTEGPGGVAVLDREKIRDAEPGDGRPRAPLTNDEVERFGHELGGEA